VLEHRLERLVPAVRRAIRESEERRERAHAEETLRRSEQQFRTLVERMPVATYIQQTIEPGMLEIKPTVYASPQIEAMSGYPPQAFVEDPELWIKLLHPEDRERVLAEDRRTDETGEPFRVEYRQITRDGRLVWIRDEAVLVGSEDGYPRFWQGVMYDITDRKRAEEALRERGKVLGHLRANLGGHRAGPVRWELVEGQRQALPDPGYSREEIVGVDFRDILLPEDLVRDLERGARMMEGEFSYYSEERRIRHKDGSRRWMHLTVSLIYSAGEPESYVGMVQDITEQKRDEEALRQSEELYRTVVEQAAENIFIVDVETKRILETNASLRRSLGYTPEEFEDNTLYDIVAHDRHSVDRNTQSIIEEGRRFLGERRYRRKDGSLVEVEVSASTIFYEGGEAMSIVAHDITERKRAEERLRQSFSVLLALREASQILNSTLSSEEIVVRLLEIMRSASNLTAAVISMAAEQGDLRVRHSVGLDALWDGARYAPEAQAAREAALANDAHCLFRLRSPDSSGAQLV
jgi:PAS domain S-box-containing protein